MALPYSHDCADCLMLLLIGIGFGDGGAVMVAEDDAGGSDTNLLPQFGSGVVARARPRPLSPRPILYFSQKQVILLPAGNPDVRRDLPAGGMRNRRYHSNVPRQGARAGCEGVAMLEGLVIAAVGMAGKMSYPQGCLFLQVQMPGKVSFPPF